MHFGILNHLDVAHKCDRRIDRQAERPFAIVSLDCTTAKGCSICLSVCHTREPHLNGLRYRNTFCNIKYSNISIPVTMTMPSTQQTVQNNKLKA